MTRPSVPQPEVPLDVKLAPLDYVDASVFESADNDEQEVCDFVLSLALVYNDLNDLRWAFTELVDRAKGLEPISPEAGKISGMREHTIRLLYALHHELLILIARNPKPQEHKLFQRILNRIGPRQRSSWQSITAAAFCKPKNDPAAMLLIRVRDEIASHYYGMKALAKGFKAHYDGTQFIGRKLFVSRGISLFSSRFYFADGAAESGVRHIRQEKGSPEVSDKIGNLSNNMAQSIYAIVIRFMEDRSGGWHRYDKARGT